MKIRKSIKLQQQIQSPYSKPSCNNNNKKLNIKFELTQSNLSCFIHHKNDRNKKTLSNQKKQRRKSTIKKTVAKGEERPTIKLVNGLAGQKDGEQIKQLEQNSRQNQQIKQNNTKISQNTQNIHSSNYSVKGKSTKKRQQESPDIIKLSNSILNEIQLKGIRHNWKQNDENLIRFGNTKKQKNHQNYTQQNHINHSVEDINQIEGDEKQAEIWSNVFSVNQNQSFTTTTQNNFENFNEKQKSYASTMDYHVDYPHHSTSQIFNHSSSLMGYHHPHQNEYNMHILFRNEQYSKQQRSQSFNQSPFSNQIRLDQIGFDPRTTIMIRNIPNKYTIKELSEQIDYYFDNTYDFLYLPCDLKNQCNVGYGFINFVDTIYLRDFYLAFHNQKWAKFRSEKICNLTYARLQGLDNLVEHFENSKVLNQKEKKYRPIIKRNNINSNNSNLNININFSLDPNQHKKIHNLIRTQQQK